MSTEACLGNKFAQKLGVLKDVALELVGERDLESLLGLIVEKATEVLEADRTTLYLVEKDGEGEKGTKTLVSRISQGDLRLRLNIDHNSVAGWVASTGRSVRIDDAYSDPRFDRSWDLLSGYKTRSMVAAPMINPAGEVIGVIQVLNKRTARTFEPLDEKVLTAFGAQAAMAIENARYLSRQKETFESVIRGQAVAIDARDHITAGHTLRVSAYCLEVGKLLGLNPEELEVLQYSALLHDQGKLGMPDEVLLKPAGLSEKEAELMKGHAVLTKEILSRLKHLFPRKLRTVVQIASSHHEKLDGSGYPDGLGGEAIPLLARILTVVDIFDALTATRQYREPCPEEEALRILRQEAVLGKVDSKVVEALGRALPALRRAKAKIEGEVVEGQGWRVFGR